MKKIRIIFIPIILALFFSSCEKNPQLPSNKYTEKDSTSSEMIKLNTLMAEVEQGEIQAYIQKSGIKYESSSLGVWYAITKQGNGKSIGKQNIILIEYQIETIHGDTIYLYTKNAKRELKVGKMEKERGFDNALTLLKEGCEATIIVPSNLAFGILGDRDRIPPRATLIYRIKDIKIKQ